MLYVRQPSAAARAELKRMTRQEGGRVSQRAQMILLSAQRRTVPEIAALFEVSRATVRFWIRQCEAEGPAGLRDDPRSGRPRAVTPQAEETLTTLLAQDPQQVQATYLATVWTVAMLVLTLRTRLQLDLRARAVRTALPRLGVRWRRPRLAMPRKTDPENAQQQWASAEAVIAAGPEAAVRYADESRVQPRPLVRARWSWAGQRWRIATPGAHATRATCGALEPRTGRWTSLVRERMRKEDVIACLDHLLLAYPHQASILVGDNDSSHTAGDVRAWLAEHPRLRLCFLPQYCSHLNPVERIWLRLKAAVAAHRLDGSLRLLLTTVDRFFAAMTPEQALRWAAES